MRRSEFLRTAAAGLVGTAISATPLRLVRGEVRSWGPAIDPDIEAFFTRSIIFDGLVNLSVRRGEGSPDLEPGTVKNLTGINLGNMTTRVQRLESLNAWMEERAEGTHRVLRASDLATALETRRHGVIYYVQQAFDEELHGSIEPLAIWKDQGLRALQVTYQDNLLGGGSFSDDLPLTGLGRRVVRELNRLHMMVDVSHTGRRTTLDVTEYADGPVTANHANARRLTDHRRNKTDEELRAIAATGGVVGLTIIGRFMLRDPSRPATIDDFIAHIDYMVNLIGIDHVGVASDSYLDGSQVFDVDFSDPYINSYDRWKHVAYRLRSMGYTDEDLEKILGLNFLRVYHEVLEP
jgi:membrane dipeptidase